MKIVKIVEENSEWLHEFQWNYQGDCDNIKSYKKSGLHSLSLENTILEKPQGGSTWPCPSLFMVNCECASI